MEDNVGTPNEMRERAKFLENTLEQIQYSAKLFNLRIEEITNKLQHIGISGASETSFVNEVLECITSINVINSYIDKKLCGFQLPSNVDTPRDKYAPLMLQITFLRSQLDEILEKSEHLYDRKGINYNCVDERRCVIYEGLENIQNAINSTLYYITINCVGVRNER